LRLADTALAAGIQHLVHRSGQRRSLQRYQGCSRNRFAADQSWTFETLADTTAPSVIYRTPDNGTLDIPGNAVSVEVTFSEQVQNVNAATFTLRKDFGDLAAVSCNVSYTYDPVNKCRTRHIDSAR
jgi:hypothetical protein